MRDKKITEKQEHFVQGLIKGLSQRQAYMESYNADRMKPETIDESASKLLKNPKVAARFEELRGEIIEAEKRKLLWTREQSISKLKDLAEKAENEIKESGIRTAAVNALLGAIKELNDMEGFKVQKIEHFGSMDINSPNMGELTVEELRRLANLD